MSTLTDIRDRAYADYIRTEKDTAANPIDLILDATEAGFKAVWDASIAARPKAAITPLTDIHMNAYSAHIRNTRHVGPTDERLARAANEAGLQAVWDAAAAAPRPTTLRTDR